MQERVLKIDRAAMAGEGLGPTVSETVSENTERVLQNSGELSQIVLDLQRENPYSPRI
jgi:hypothetical protein